MERNSTLRFDFASEMVAEFIKNCARKLFFITRQYQTYGDEVKVLGDAGPVAIEYERKDIEGEYIFSINVEDMALVTRQQRIKEAYDKLVALAQFPEVKKWPLLRDLLLAFGEEEIEEYLHPPQGPPIDPGFENQMMMRGVPIKPNPNDNHQLHIQTHEAFMQTPEYAIAVGKLPQINAVFSEHLQLTLNLAEQQAREAETTPKAGRSASLQQGGGQATSQPVGGAQNQQGPSGNPLLQAMGGLLGQRG